MSEKKRRWPRRIAIGTACVTALAGASVVTLGIRLPDYPETLDGDPSDALDHLLQAVVRRDGVDYEALATRRPSIGTIAGAFGRWGPHSAPAAFNTREERLAYQLNAYNALVLAAVDGFGPIASVQDVRGWLEPKAGFGFFWAVFHKLDGRRINLYDLENKVIRGFGDARIHAAINCASISCPDLGARAFRPDTLDAQLDEASRRFVSSNRHVRLEDGRAQVSAIFDWYRDDFGSDEGIRAFIRTYCATESCAIGNAPLHFLDYDWSLNAAKRER